MTTEPKNVQHFINGQWVEFDGIDPETGKNIWVKHPHK
jgi:hypothetical protein